MTPNNTVVTLPRNLTLKQFQQEICNLYYGRDNDALTKLLNEVKEVDHESPVQGG